MTEQTALGAAIECRKQQVSGLGYLVFSSPAPRADGRVVSYS